MHEYISISMHTAGVQQNAEIVTSFQSSEALRREHR